MFFTLHVNSILNIKYNSINILTWRLRVGEEILTISRFLNGLQVIKDIASFLINYLSRKLCM